MERILEQSSQMIVDKFEMQLFTEGCDELRRSMAESELLKIDTGAPKSCPALNEEIMADSRDQQIESEPEAQTLRAEDIVAESIEESNSQMIDTCEESSQSCRSRRLSYSRIGEALVRELSNPVCSKEASFAIQSPAIHYNISRTTTPRSEKNSYRIADAVKEVSPGVTDQGQCVSSTSRRSRRLNKYPM